MRNLNRRGFLRYTAPLAATGSLLLADPLKQDNLGVELYTVRDLLPKDPAGVLEEIKAIGYAEVEATDYDETTTVWDALTRSGLKMRSVHLNTKVLAKGDSAIQAKMEQFKKLGFAYVVYPYVEESARGGPDAYKKLAETLTKAAKGAKDQGLEFCYHNHAFEFKDLGSTNALEILMKNTEGLKLEMDIFWVTVAGHDPVKLLKTYSGRVPLLHIKDKAKGMPASTQYNEHVPKETFKEAGNGSIDIPTVLKAANTAGVKHYFVEQDQTPDPMRSLRQSYSYLSTLIAS